jgi:hypothetical protein
MGMDAVQLDRLKLDTPAQEGVLSFLILDLLCEEMASELEQKYVTTGTWQMETDVLQLELSKWDICDQEDLQVLKTLAKKFEEIRRDSIHWEHIETMEI